MSRTMAVVSFFGIVLIACSAFAEDSAKSELSDQRMAASPEALMKVLSEVSFLPPGDYEAKLNAEKSATIHSFWYRSHRTGH